MQITLGQQYNVGEKSTVILLYIYINRHGELYRVLSFTRRVVVGKICQKQEQY